MHRIRIMHRIMGIIQIITTIVILIITAFIWYQDGIKSALKFYMTYGLILISLLLIFNGLMFIYREKRDC
jgi:amino acid transporter